MSNNLDTIVAISTPPGYSGVSVIRLSGKEAPDLAKKHFKLPKGNKLLEIIPRKVYYGYFIDQNEEAIDECLMFYMKSPNSYTGEDVVEFQCHGGIIIPLKIVEELLKNRGLVRYAEPGEFTYRAFLNGKKDLIQAEAVESIVHSKNTFHQKSALKQLSGFLGKALKDYFSFFEEKKIFLEAAINFPEEVGDNFVSIDDKLREFYFFIEELIQSYREIEPYVMGIKAIIIGKPNVGKSSFMNLLLNNERVIVSPYPGTTRDIIEEEIILEGMPLRIIDTAGIRFTDDPVESIGIEKTKEKLLEAHIIFSIFDASEPPSKEDMNIIDIIKNKRNVFVILNKIDKGINGDIIKLFEGLNVKVTKMSILKRQGFEEFKKIFKDSLIELYSFREDKDFYVTSPRHYEIFLNMKEILITIMDRKPHQEELLFALTDLISLYDKLIGRNISEDDINQIFSRFCIGK